ncbi:hypothetical protein PILCRDRAFT_662228 [Piloderma croceum F 1598]|uniref:Uncharacterized protein n=1 Tax=Piloderma croceum (strain F 1598) TaxID=765440 RepID=A0A0C3ETI1_PILCF|nr:hypothetical protein PILCRDRAFT_662228 [Piloderma croceum F 1598]
MECDLLSTGFPLAHGLIISSDLHEHPDSHHLRNRCRWLLLACKWKDRSKFIAVCGSHRQFSPHNGTVAELLIVSPWASIRQIRILLFRIGTRIRLIIGIGPGRLD